MCTVVIRVPENGTDPVRVLAVRDEDPARPWNPLGAWWPTRPGVVGVQDQLAGGAWLAAANGGVGGRLAVILNRLGEPDLPAPQIVSRGGIVLDAVSGNPLPSEPKTLGFNLVAASESGAELSSWDGRELRTSKLTPGTHMIAHEDLDDARTPRIVAWRGAFAEASTEGAVDEWWRPWLTVLEQSTELPPEDDRAIIRDNRAHGYPTLSLLACVATVSEAGADVRYAELGEAGRWSELDFTREEKA